MGCGQAALPRGRCLPFGLTVRCGAVREHLQATLKTVCHDNGGRGGQVGAVPRGEPNRRRGVRRR